MNSKRVRYARARASGLRPKQAALVAGYAAGTAATAVSKLDNAKDVRWKMRELMRQSGNVTPERVAQEIDRGLKDGAIGRHSDYLHLAADILGMGQADESKHVTHPLAIMLNFGETTDRRGWMAPPTQVESEETPTLLEEAQHNTDYAVPAQEQAQVDPEPEPPTPYTEDD